MMMESTIITSGTVNSIDSLVSSSISSISTSIEQEYNQICIECYMRTILSLCFLLRICFTILIWRVEAMDLDYGNPRFNDTTIGSSQHSAAISCFDSYESDSSLEDGVFWVGLTNDNATQVFNAFFP